MAEHRFHTPGPIELDLSVPAGDVDVETVDGEESVVVVEGDERIVEQTEVTFDGHVLSVSFRGAKPFGIVISIGDFSFGNGKLRVRARIPHASRARLTTASADVKLRGRLESLETKTASGDLALSGEVERDATVKTVSGDVRLLLAGQTLSMFGDWAMIIVVGIWAKVLTGSNAQAGLVFFVFALAGLLAPIGGLVVDRLPKRRLMIATHLSLAAVICLLLFVYDRGDHLLLYVVTALCC